MLLRRLRRIRLGRGGFCGAGFRGERLKIIDPGIVPERPSSPNLPLNVPKDFLPVGFVGEQPFFFCVAPSLGVSTLAEFIARAKSKPGEISYAATGRGTLPILFLDGRAIGEMARQFGQADDLAARLQGALHKALGLRIPVAAVPRGELPRFEMKARRWVRSAT